MAGGGAQHSRRPESEDRKLIGCKLQGNVFVKIYLSADDSSRKPEDVRENSQKTEETGARSYQERRQPKTSVKA